MSWEIWLGQGPKAWHEELASQRGVYWLVPSLLVVRTDTQNQTSGPQATTSDLDGWWGLRVCTSSALTALYRWPGFQLVPRAVPCLCRDGMATVPSGAILPWAMPGRCTDFPWAATLWSPCSGRVTFNFHLPYRISYCIRCPMRLIRSRGWALVMCCCIIAAGNGTSGSRRLVNHTRPCFRSYCRDRGYPMSSSVPIVYVRFSYTTCPGENNWTTEHAFLE